MQKTEHNRIRQSKINIFLYNFSLDNRKLIKPLQSTRSRARAYYFEKKPHIIIETLQKKYKIHILTPIKFKLEVRNWY
jgi:hypothetical protein